MFRIPPAKELQSGTKTYVEGWNSHYYVNTLKSIPRWPPCYPLNLNNINNVQLFFAVVVFLKERIRNSGALIISMPVENLADIIQGSVNGVEAAQKKLYETYKGLCLKLIFRYIFNYEKAIDVLHDGFVKIYRNLYSFRQMDGPEGEWLFVAWIKRIMINTAIDQLKTASKDPALQQMPLEIWDIPDHSEKADKLILYRDMIMLIKQLPPDYRIVFNMFMIDGINQHDIAETLKIPVNTVKSKIKRSKAILRKNLHMEYSVYV